MVVADHHGIQNVYTMLKYAQDRVTCRRVQFERYFSSERYSCSLTASTAASKTGTCNACDNCLAVNYTTQDITEALRDLCRLVEVINTETEKEFNQEEYSRAGVTLLRLAELWRGCGGKRVDVEQARSAQLIQLMGKQWNIEVSDYASIN
jgi:ATP-dependent DNA helicase Q1